MALSADTVIEVRTTGNDNNGGGFVSSATGQDYSQQDSAAFNGTNLQSHASDNTKVIPDGHTPEANDVGNLVQITTTGTGFTTGWYEIVAQDGTYWTLDKTCGGTSLSGATWYMGGALATMSPAVALMTVAGMTLFVKSGTYVIGTGIQTPTTVVNNSLIRIIGYGSTRGDGTHPVIQTSAAITAFEFKGRGYRLMNVTLDGNGIGTTGLVFSNYFNRGVDVTITNFTAEGTTATGLYEGSIHNSEVSGCAGTAAIYFTGGYSSVMNTWAHDNTSTGICVKALGARVVGCRATNNTGTSSDGIRIYRSGLCQNNTSHGNGRDGIRLDDRNYIALAGRITDNLLTDNSGYGLRPAESYSNARPNPLLDYNAFWNNTVHRLSFEAGSNDVELSADPFTDAASDDYSLNNTAGAGADCRGAGSRANIDIGAVQHADPKARISHNFGSHIFG